MVEVRRLALPEVLEMRTRRLVDERGFFSETWSEQGFAEAGADMSFVQDNHSYSAKRGVLRGLHYQVAPAVQAKLVRVIRGAIYDVAVDIRASSPSFGKWISLTVSAEEWNQIFIPEGFAHGFVTLADDTEVAYKVTAPYRPDLDRALRWDDPDLSIDWPVERSEVLLSPKDAHASLLSEHPELL